MNSVVVFLFAITLLALSSCATHPPETCAMWVIQKQDKPKWVPPGFDPVTTYYDGCNWCDAHSCTLLNCSTH